MTELFDVFLLGLALSMDAFAVSISNGISFPNRKRRQIGAALTYGIFQAVMPLIGYFAGQAFSRYVEAIDHWIALILLGILGGKTLIDGIKGLRNPEQTGTEGEFTWKLIVTQGIATSIDALAAGVTIAMSFEQTSVWTAVSLIGLTTFVCCLIGAFLGKKFGALLKEYAAVAGGLILIGIGIKIFAEHVFF